MKTALTLAALTCATAACGDSTPMNAAPATVAHQRAPIVMGREARAGETLSTVALIDPSGYAFCTGTLVAPTVVISAAHCFADPDSGAWVGPDDLLIGVDTLDASPAPRASRVAVDRFTVHPDYVGDAGESERADGLGRDNDIAVLVLAAPAPQAVSPILPVGMLDRLEAGTALVISGYGITDLNEARDRAGLLHIGETPFLARSAYEFIAGGDGVTDTCNGDSGGPAYLTVAGARYLVGATSRAAHDANAQCGDRGIYTLVPAYREWIDAVVAGDAAALTPPPALDDGEGEWDEGEWDEGEWDEGEWDDGEPDADVCDEEGFYGDGECDDFCDLPDPDCGGEGGPDDDAEPEADAPDDDAEPEADAPDDDAEPEADAPDDDAEPEAAEPQDDPDVVELTDEGPSDIDELREDLGCSVSAVGAGGSGWSLLLPLLGLGWVRRRRS